MAGDRARLAEVPGGEARVRSIAQRSSVLERGDPGSAHRTKPVAVNVDVALLGMEPQTLLASFPELEALAFDCPRGCSHVDSPSCALAAGVAARGAALEQRYASFAKLMRDS